MIARNHFIFWSLAALAFAGFVFLFKSVLLPFVLGIAVAYLLNPLVNRLGKWGLNRGAAALFILSMFLVIAGGLLAILIPVLARELAEFAGDLPGYIDRLEQILTPYSDRLQALVDGGQEANIKELLTQNSAVGLDTANKLLIGVAAGGTALIGFISLVVIMPVVAYFMMKEWPKITDWVIDLMPRQHKPTIMDLFKQIDRKLSGFVRGQLSVAFILAVFYAVALTIAGLKYGFLIGFGAGMLSIIPMVGSAVGFVVGVIMAWMQTGEWSFVAIVAGIFIAGQVVEGNFLTPKLVGNSVGLHTLWVFFALMAGGALFGILGMFLAVPVAAVAGVLIAFGIARYKASPYYKQEKPAKDKKHADKKNG